MIQSFRGKPHKPFDLTKALKKFRLNIFLWGFLFFCLLTPFAWLFNETYYIATGILRVAPTLNRFLTDDKEINLSDFYQDYVQTQVSRLNQVQLIMNALNRLPPKLKELYIKPHQDPMEAAVDLQKDIKVAQIPKTQFISVQMRGIRSEGLAEMVNAVINVYLEKIQEEEEGSDNRRLTYLQQERKQLLARVAQQRTALAQIAAEAKVSTFNMVEDNPTIALREVKAAHTLAEARAMESKSRYENSLKEAEALRGIPIAGLIEDQTQTNPVLSNTKLLTSGTLIELEAATSGVKLTNPDRQFAEMQKGHLSDYIQKLESDVRKQQEQIITAKRDLDIEQKIVGALYQYKIYAQLEKELNTKLKAKEEETAVRSAAFIKGRQVQEDLQAMTELLEKLDTRIYNLSVESKAPGRISLENIARSLKYDIFMLLLSLAGVVSFGSVSAYYAIKDLRDCVIRSKQDIENAIGATPSWPIPDYRLDNGTKTAFSAITINAPESIPAKAIRSLAVKLNKERLDNSSKVAVFSGINSKAGTSSILINAAHSMSMLCRRILVIDLNIRHPQIRDFIHSWKNDKGLIDFLQGMGDLSDCTVRDEKRRIDLLLIPEGCGPDWLNRCKFHQALAEMRERYDFILIDSEPLIQSDLTEFLMAEADIAVPIIQGNRTIYEELYQTVHLLWRMQVKAIAPVLNWLSLRTIHKQNHAKSKLRKKWIRKLQAAAYRFRRSHFKRIK